ncbi:DeoR/GlpR family DNA-binding transcription regulator [Aureimonas sp. AU22]|uniref:DeoR/GlpR family DNA-binding transcription regulator n=1 Tax=Aureimonas sp. AU22 TaxID=1638162 RepID=UPI00192D0B2E|nr:DeoR/GlpR family DNA-binding transcription regulator [Aureimonas sp. AU22]
MKAIERHRRIIDLLQADGRVDVEHLCGALGVSSVTVRADLLYLEKAQVLRRIRGGAIAVRPSRYERPIDLNASLHGEEKDAIAAVAAEMIRDGETVIIDTGSTMAALATAFPRSLTDVAVVTNALNVATALANHPGVTVIVTGGTVRPQLNSLVSPFGTLLLAEINADVAFMSCAGVEPRKGFTNSNWQEAEIKKAMIQAASRVIFLADHSKLGHVATARIAALEEADLLITDKGASADTIRELKASGLEVAIA